MNRNSQHGKTNLLPRFFGKKICRLGCTKIEPKNSKTDRTESVARLFSFLVLEKHLTNAIAQPILIDNEFVTNTRDNCFARLAVASFVIRDCACGNAYPESKLLLGEFKFLSDLFDSFLHLWHLL